ncbi:hypothetical protein HanLR1_Chr13g0506351 [Helianthus annuus]|nr:hypothetical protein HanLR1_Chr13g0506351 [Helianthus annuus]
MTPMSTSYLKALPLSQRKRLQKRRLKEAFMGTDNFPPSLSISPKDNSKNVTLHIPLLKIGGVVKTLLLK